MTTTRDKPGRNDPCWCGSGRKYKKCHQATDGKTGDRGRDVLALDSGEREKMRRACQFNAELLDVVRPSVCEGVSTAKLDRIVHEYTLDHGHVPACLGYQGFPRSSCTSVNEVVCHGIPSDDEVLRNGDIVNVDLTTIVDGWYGDQSETFMIGEVPESTRQLVQVTFESLWLAIRAITPNCSVNDIGRAIVEHAHAGGYSVVTQYQGHGIGRNFHQDPSVLHYPVARYEGVRLKPGYCFTIEPMINLGREATVLDRRDGWTVRTKDSSLSAQFEHTILMTESGPEILTQTADGPAEGHRF